ncbi:ATP-binding protein [Kordia sp. SMS9]|uniref:ATP-binding protein n=1 Tax=Kordia sp. SMS9 TaxID=2282170 RepID=UPI0013B363D2|nr:ATP-binding protein [Kordia sp. SMS9]
MKISEDISEKAFESAFTKAQSILSSFENKKENTQNSCTPSLELYTKTVLLLIDVYNEQKQYDSVAVYCAKIKNRTTDIEMLGDAELYIADKKIFEKKYFESIRLLHTALAYFEEANAVDKKVDTYLKLAEQYKKIRNFELSKEVDSILMNHYVHQQIPKTLQAQIYINNAQYKAFTGNNAEAIRLLKSLDIQNFIQDKKVLQTYYRVLKRRYIKADNIDSARVYMEKVYSIKNEEQPEDTAIKYIYLAMMELKLKQYQKALMYVNKAKTSNALQYVEQFDMIKLYKVEYLANEVLGNFNKAFQSLANYHEVRNSVKNFNLNLNASILNFKLHHDKKIRELKAKTEMSALVMKQKKQFYIFSTFFVSATIFILIFFFILQNRKKKRLKLQYENEKMKEVAEIKTDFIENLSHEIRTPITIITGYLRMISNNTMDYSKIVKYSDLTIRNNEQIIEMLNNSLTLLKLDRSPLVHKCTTEKMEGFLRESIYAFQGVSEIKNVAIYYKSNIKLDQVLDFYYEDLKKILNNILSNALKFTNPGKGIYVHTFINKKGLTVFVKDEGIGIDKEEQKLIFDRFYQTKNNLSNGGFGIGLSLVYELVKKLNGTITLDSEKNVGSIFTIQLPLAIQNHALYTEEKSTDYVNICNETVVESSAITNLPKILIVDDNIEMIGYLKELLSPTLNCTFAFDGKQAVSFALKTKYDIVLTDLGMPVLDGCELKSALDKVDGYETVPFLVMTASAEEYLENNKAALGINDYLTKPFKAIELITRINYHLDTNIYRQQLQSTDDEKIEYNGAYADFMEKINTVIQKNMSNSDFTIQDLAASCGYSYKQFRQIVQEKTGMKSVQIILEVRLRKAYDLIVNNNYENISEILYAVGLNSRSYFNKVFVKRFGLKPSELIKKCKIQKRAS